MVSGIKHQRFFIANLIDDLIDKTIGIQYAVIKRINQLRFTAGLIDTNTLRLVTGKTESPRIN